LNELKVVENIEVDNTVHGVGHKVEVASLNVVLEGLHMDRVGHLAAALVYKMALGMFVVEVIGVLVDYWALVALPLLPYDSKRVGLVGVDCIGWDIVLVADLEVDCIDLDTELVVVPLEIVVEVDYIVLVVDLLEVEWEVDYIVKVVDLEQVLYLD
jgi:hypothetical protein